jgi:hypothetical protein
MNELRRKQRIIAQARATLANRPAPYTPRDEPLRAFEPAPDEYIAGLDTRPPPQTIDWNAVVEQRLEQRLVEEHEHMLALMAELVADTDETHQKELADAHEKYAKLLADERAAHERELLELKKGLDRLEATFKKLAEFEARHKAIADLPAVMPARGDMN